MQLEILRLGVESWNAWRMENPSERSDLSFADLHETVLRGANLSSVVLCGADLRGADLSEANLRAADLSEAKLCGAVLNQTDLVAAVLRDTLLNDADLLGANLKAAVLKKADLSGADFTKADLSGAVLCGADLCGADFSEANLRAADLSEACLRGAVLKKTDLIQAHLPGANLRHAVLIEANLHRANLGEADLSGADLTKSDLSGADLTEANLFKANLHDVNFRAAQFLLTVLSFSDMREARGLESIRHRGPSVLGVDVLQRSQGQLPEGFLRGCGLSDWEIEAAKLHDLGLTIERRTTILYEIECLRGEQPIQINRLFMSYSHADTAFVEALEPQLDERGIRYWRDVHDMMAGRMETQIDRAIRLNPTVLLALSKNSVESDWVEWEVAKARKLEKELGRDVLCPVALDEAWRSCSWSGPLRQQIERYHILDFSGWRDVATFERQFAKLLDGLKLFYKPPDGN